MDIQKTIKEELQKILKEYGEVGIEEISLTASDSRDHGDYSSNIAFKKAKIFGMKPIDLANRIASVFHVDGVRKCEAVMPGFLNFFLESDELGRVVSKILEEKDNYGNLEHGKGVKVNIEFVSANPTGTLHLGHARGAAIGDSLARIYKKAGYSVTKEYYVNDAGHQMDNLGKSLMCRYLELCGQKVEFPEDGYHGQEIIEMATELYKEVGESLSSNPESHFEYFKDYGGKHLLDAIKKDLHEFRVDHDVYTSEKEIRSRGLVQVVLEKLKPYCYRQDEALFLNTTKDGDDKDRVLIKSDGSYTYLLPDIAYHADKFMRGYDILIDVLGADHHGYITRLKSSVKDLGFNPEKLEVALVQMVRLFKDGEEFKMSKRTGNAISMKELVEECSLDAVRYFFVSRSGNSHLDFDIDLARTLGSENPVFYVQYTHARLAGILKNGESFLPLSERVDLLSTDSEKSLLILLASYPNVILSACKENEPYKITNYVQELSSSINEFYTKCRVLDDKDVELSKERLALVQASKIVLKDALSLIGVSAPERMVSDKKEESSL